MSCRVRSQAKRIQDFFIVFKRCRQRLLAHAFPEPGDENTLQGLWLGAILLFHQAVENLCFIIEPFNWITFLGALGGRHLHLTSLLIFWDTTSSGDVRKLRCRLARWLLLQKTCRDLRSPPASLRLPLGLFLGAGALRCRLLHWAFLTDHCSDRYDAPDRDHLHDLCAFSAHLTIDSGSSGVLHSCALRRLPNRHPLRQLHQLNENIPLLVANFNIVARIHYTELAVVKRRTAAAYLIISSSLLYLHNLTQRRKIIK